MAQTLNQAAGDQKTVVAEIVRYGEKLVIPDGMELSEAKKLIADKEKDEETVINLSENFDCFVFEGAYALAKTLDDTYGWFQQTVKEGTGFFDPDLPPALLSVKISKHKTVQVPWGAFLVPGIPKRDGVFSTGYQKRQDGMIVFQLTGTLRKKHSRQFHELCAAVRKQLKKTSLYRGKAIDLRFRDEDGDRINLAEVEFSDIPKISAEDLIFSRHIEEALSANLYTPIQKTELFRELGMSLKLGVGLAGPYGTGKTLVAARTATIAAENNWTFIKCSQAKDFTDCVRFAHNYQPAIVFCEDIDRVTDGDRDAAMDDILNTIDGIDSKRTEILLVLTTNEVESIHPAMLRPGRLDAVIHVDRPNAEAVERLIRRYAGNQLLPDEPLSVIGRLLAGSTPAVISEVVSRAKRVALSVGNSKEIVLTEKALTVSAETMRMQLDLLNREQKPALTDMEVLGNVLGAQIGRAMREIRELKPNMGTQLASLPGVVRANGVLEPTEHA